MGTQRGRTADSFLAHRGLIALVCSGAMAEAGLLIVIAPAARSLAPQVTALPPWAIFHDLRWLYGAQRPWPAFTLLLAGLVVARSAVNSLLIHLSWPAGVSRPAVTATLRSSLVLTVIACLLMSPVVSLAFGVAIVPFSWPFLGSLPALLLIALPLSHGGVVSNWWRRLPPLTAVGWLLADFVILSASAAATGRLPAGAAVPMAGLAGLVNARAWYGMTAAVALPREPAHPASIWLVRGIRRIPAGPVAITTALLLVTVATRLAFLVGMSPARPGQVKLPVPGVTAVGPGAGRDAAGQGTSLHRPVLEVPGFGSSCCNGVPLLARVMPDAVVQQFSYRGLTASGRPLPYGRPASNLPLSVLGNRIAGQVRRLHAETGRLVNVVAESEGTLGVDAMLAEHPDVPVGSVVLLSPIVAPGRVSYRLDSGTRLVPGDELQAVVWFVGGLSPFGTAGAETLINSVNSVGARFAAAASRRPVRWLALVPLADALTLPVCRLRANVEVVPAFHGELLGEVPVLRMVRDFLLHRPVRSPPGMQSTAEVVAAAAAAWRMPETTTPSPPCRK